MKITIIILFAMLSSSALSAGWTAPGKIIEISIEHRENENDLYLKLELSLNTNCQYKNIVTLTADSEEKLNRLYSTALAAKLSSVDVSVYIQDECNLDNRPKSNRLKI